MKLANVIVISLVLLVSACDDVGLMQQDFSFKISDSGFETRPTLAPYGISTVDDLPIQDAVVWWNDQVGRDVILTNQPVSDFIAEIGYVPCIDLDACPSGLARVVSSVDDGAILSCNITISSDITYDEVTVLHVLKHEIGECLGLADDCGPPACVDLRSIMSNPLDPLGELTEHDRVLIIESME